MSKLNNITNKTDYSSRYIDINYTTSYLFSIINVKNECYYYVHIVQYVQFLNFRNYFKSTYSYTSNRYERYNNRVVGIKHLNEKFHKFYMRKIKFLTLNKYAISY